MYEDTQVLLDTGEWCPARISAPRNKALKYEVMFGDDESDTARLPVPTDRACLAAGTRVQVCLCGVRVCVFKRESWCVCRSV